jgi:protein-disulfide isomerase
MAFIGPESEWAAEATECANEQGKFWEYHDKLFDNQGGENVGAFSKANLKRFAGEMKLDTAAFNVCLDSDKYLAKVRADTAQSSSMGVSSTPTLFINGRMLEGAPPYDQLAQLLNSMLPKP